MGSQWREWSRGEMWSNFEDLQKTSSIVLNSLEPIDEILIKLILIASKLFSV
jgi:hypothetical protein